MALQNAVQLDRHTSQRITWSAGDTAKDLTNATVTGTITDEAGTTRAITGTLTLITAASGIFDWAYGAADTADEGEYQVQFTATYASDSLPDSSFSTAWKVVVKY